MPVHSKALTDKIARELDPPATGYTIYWCPKTAGFGVRVTAGGARAWITERRVDGKPTRRTLGVAPGSLTLRRTFETGKQSTGADRVPASGAVSIDKAKALQIDVSSELQRGTDRLEVKRERIKAAKVEAVTFEAALKAYVNGKRRAKDKLPLMARTVADYQAMLAPAGETKVTKKPTHAGELHALAARPLHKITADDIRAVHKALQPRGERRQTYAMQVLRAVLRHHGVAIVDNPLSTTTAGAQRVQLAPSRGDPSPIPPEKLGAWWRAACTLASTSADQLRFMLLTGARPGEAAGLLAGDVDLIGMRGVLRDTKNRRDHTLVLSTQAGAIVHWHAEGKKPNELVFGVADTGKTIATINAVAETPGVSPHKLRHTFASIAAELVPAFTLRKLLNHSSGGDVAAAHYVGVSEAQLRAAWQAVADFIEKAK